MLPCNIRRRSCSGDESTSSVWLALRTTQSGTRSRTFAPVICSTASARLSMCWMLSVVMTSIPASRSSSTSSQRLAWRPDPGTLVWASSSTRATLGWRASTASRSISSNVAPRYSTETPGHDLEAFEEGLGQRPLVAFDEAHDDVRAALTPTPSFVEHVVGLAYPGDGSQVDAEMARGRDDLGRVLVYAPRAHWCSRLASPSFSCSTSM